MFDPVSTIVYAASRDQVSDVWVAGQRKLQAGQLQGLDHTAITRRAQHWRDRITEHLATNTT